MNENDVSAQRNATFKNARNKLEHSNMSFRFIQNVNFNESVDKQ